MKVMVIGGGGREMALVQALARGASVDEVIVAGGSDAIAELDAVSQVLPLTGDATRDWEALADEAERIGVDLTVVGPESPLAAGAVDVFHNRGLTIFGPTRSAARLESSKAYAKQIMMSAGVPTPGFELATSVAHAHELLDSAAFPIVLKQDGLKAGKGVTICADSREARELVDALGAAGAISLESPLLLEEFLDGFEFSLIVMATGTDVIALPVAQDHKPIGEGNTGANTGGMGAVTPVPRVSAELYRETVDSVIKPVLAEMVNESNPFTGFLYAGLMATANGVKVIEFNTRLGDPEAEVILPLIESDLAAAIMSLLGGSGTTKLDVSGETCLGVVLSAPGYPGAVTDQPVIPARLLELVAGEPRAEFVHMGTARTDDAGGWRSSGGRVAIVTMRGESIARCRADLNALLEDGLAGSPLYWRRDIGTFAG